MLTDPIPPQDSAGPAAPSPFPKRATKLPYLLGGLTVILVTLALGLSFFGPRRNQLPDASSGPASSVTGTGSTLYTNNPNFYALRLPPKWNVVETSPTQTGTVIIQPDAQAILTITSTRSNSSLDDYLASLQDGRTVTSSKPVKINDFEGIERSESWAQTGLEPLITYLKVQDQLYIFTLLPSGGSNALTNETLLRDYRTTLATFTLTSTANLGKDWQTYSTKKIAGLSFPSFSLRHPQSWAITEKSVGGGLTVSLYRNNYEISITQAAVGSAVCLFKDSPPFEGSSGDLRNKAYIEFSLSDSLILRRYFNANAGEKSTFFFCGKQESDPYFQTPLSIGGLVYTVPAKYDEGIIKEMDEIVKTIIPLPGDSTP